jgi:hypothetical protein
LIFILHTKKPLTPTKKRDSLPKLSVCDKGRLLQASGTPILELLLLSSSAK